MTDKLVKRDDPGALANSTSDGWIMSSVMADTLFKQGVSPSMVNTPDVVHHAKTTWEDLCTFGTRDRKTMVSPIIIITLVDANLDAPQEFKDYKGVVRFEFTTEFGATLFLTHAMTYADTGELTPLWAWLSAQQTPFLARLAYIETRNSERHVVRPVPRDIEIV